MRTIAMEWLKRPLAQKGVKPGRRRGRNPLRPAEAWYALRLFGERVLRTLLAAYLVNASFRTEDSSPLEVFWLVFTK
jgi:hypothetical protein